MRILPEKSPAFKRSKARWIGGLFVQKLTECPLSFTAVFTRICLVDSQVGHNCVHLAPHVGQTKWRVIKRSTIETSSVSPTISHKKVDARVHAAFEHLARTPIAPVLRKYFMVCMTALQTFAMPRGRPCSLSFQATGRLLYRNKRRKKYADGGILYALVGIILRIQILTQR